MLVHAPFRPPFALLTTVRSAGRDGLFAFRVPRQVIASRELGDVPQAIARAEQAALSGCHVVGFVSYEAAPAFDAALTTALPGQLPLVWFAVFDRALPTSAATASQEAPPLPSPGSAHWSCDDTRASFARNVECIRNGIGRGDVYQVNLTTRFRSTVPHPLALFHRLRAGQRGRFAAYIDTGPHAVVSASPELFFRRTGHRIVTRPMKGTAPRGRWLAEDEAAAAALLTSPKERAENLMIVDLLRSDLGRIARFGSVRAPRLLRVERYPTVLQLTSTVEAELRAGVMLADIFAALFPCGSVTGAPKIAAMRAIAALEPTPRGVYCGAIGYLAPGGDATFSVAIRTATVDLTSGAAVYGAGGGVTWDSTARGEYAEMRAKAALLHHAPSPDDDTFALIETMRLAGGRYARLERHLARVMDSAAHFGIPADRARILHALERHATGARRGADAERVRLVIARDGVPRVEARPVDEPSAAALPVALARDPVCRGDRFLYHKTTRRQVYDARRAARPDVFDVILTNDAGELTELTIGNLVLELDGRRVTPPRDCGLLAGTMRAELLDSGRIHERVLTPGDLARCPALWMINSVREWVPLRLVE